MVFTEDSLRPISALQHLVFCERQCALIHLEAAWADNPLTVEGSFLHERVDGSERREVRGDLVIVRGLQLRSLRLGLVGRADVVELHRSEAGAPIHGLDGRWQPYPVEYKRGKPKADRCDEVQLCAQALCLEEMLSLSIPAGSLFYGAQQRRHEVMIGEELRRATESAVARLHELLDSGETPKCERQPKCRRCSLEAVCMPGSGRRRSARKWLHRVVRLEPRADDLEAGP
jgi:CRISPR-associated exonuclease Cas4